MKIPQSKIERIQKAMVEQGFEALFSRLSVNVLFFTGHIPLTNSGTGL